MAGVEWVFKLIDEISAPAHAAESALGQLPKPIREVENQLRVMQSSMNLTKAVLDKGGLSASAFGIQLGTVSEITRNVIQGVEEVVTKVAQLGESLIHTAIDSSEMNRSLLMSFETLTGGADGATQTLALVKSMAEKAGVSAKFAAGEYRSLLGAGFNAANAQDIFAASTDVMAQTGGGEGAATQFRTIISGIEQTHSLNERVLKQLGSDLSLPTEAIAHTIALSKNMTDAAAEKLLMSGKINAEDAISGILETVHRVIDAGAGLGTKAMAVAAGSPTQQLTVLSDKFKDLFAGVSIAPLAKGFAQISGYLDEGTETGQHLRAVIGDTFDSIFAWVGKLLSGNTLAGYIESAAGWIEKLGNFGKSSFAVLGAVFGGVMDALGPLGRTLANVFSAMATGNGPSASTLATIQEIVKVCTVGVEIIGGLAAVLVGSAVAFFALPAAVIAANVAIWDWVGGKVGAIIGYIEGIAPAFATAGGHIIDGLWTGIKAGWATLITDFEGLVELLPASVRKVLGIHSPSRVMMELGGYTAEGFNDGLEEGGMSGGGVGAPEITVPEWGGGGGAGRVINLGGITVTVVAKAGDDGKQLGRDVAKSISEELESFFEGLALETSGAA